MKGNKKLFERLTDVAAEKAMGVKHSKFEEKLGSCRVCTCVLDAKTKMPGPFKLSRNQRASMQKVKCWQVTE